MLYDFGNEFPARIRAYTSRADTIAMIAETVSAAEKPVEYPFMAIIIAASRAEGAIQKAQLVNRLLQSPLQSGVQVGSAQLI